VTPDELISRYPRIYHTADARAWSAIQRFGLLPANQLRDTAGLGASTPSARRADSELVTLPGEGHVAILRDQKPLKFLSEVLDDETSVEQFLEILDSRCFFWASEARLLRLLNGRHYRAMQQVVLTLDTASPVSGYEDLIELSPYNSGSAHVPNAPVRGKTTFKRLADYDHAAWQRKRGKSGDALVEVTIRGAVPDLSNHLAEVRHFPGPDFPGSSQMRV